MKLNLLKLIFLISLLSSLTLSLKLSKRQKTQKIKDFNGYAVLITETKESKALDSINSKPVAGMYEISFSEDNFKAISEKAKKKDLIISEIKAAATDLFSCSGALVLKLLNEKPSKEEGNDLTNKLFPISSNNEYLCFKSDKIIKDSIKVLTASDQEKLKSNDKKKKESKKIELLKDFEAKYALVKARFKIDEKETQTEAANKVNYFFFEVSDNNYVLVIALTKKSENEELAKYFKNLYKEA